MRSPTAADFAAARDAGMYCGHTVDDVVGALFVLAHFL